MTCDGTFIIFVCVILSFPFFEKEDIQYSISRTTRSLKDKSAVRFARHLDPTRLGMSYLRRSRASEGPSCYRRGNKASCLANDGKSRTSNLHAVHHALGD